MPCANQLITHVIPVWEVLSQGACDRTSFFVFLEARRWAEGPLGTNYCLGPFGGFHPPNILNMGTMGYPGIIKFLIPGQYFAVME